MDAGEARVATVTYGNEAKRQKGQMKASEETLHSQDGKGVYIIRNVRHPYTTYEKYLMVEIYTTRLHASVDPEHTHTHCN